MTRAGEISGKTHAGFAYGVSIFLSAFLLFQVQLILGKYFLPWFGGTPAMWTTCIFFFQTLLLAGYLYAHAIANLVPPRMQGIVHIAVMTSTLGLFFFLATVWHSPLLPDTSWKPEGLENPVLYLIVLLSVSTGLPYLLLATTGPLLQRWFANTYPDVEPYRLYALSNLGSFLGLLSYPFLVEPWFTLKIQAELWAAGLCVFVLFCGFCALEELNRENVPRDQEHTANRRDPNKPTDWPSLWACICWLSLAACGSLLFLATTNQICQDIAVVPFLWVLPLSIYLLSLAICFERPAWYSRTVFQPGFIASLVGAIFLLNGGAITRLPLQIVIYSLILFVGCMVCHGELSRSKPRAEHLTLFYLMVAAGGALSGAFVTLIAPRVFSLFWEYPLGLWLSTLLMFLALINDKSSWIYTSRFGLVGIAVGATLLPGSITLVMHGKIGFNYLFLAAVVLCSSYIVTRNAVPGFDRTRAQAGPWFIAVAMVVLGCVVLLTARSQAQGSMLTTRNFYGRLTVQKINQNEPEWVAYHLTHGRISHGYQFQSPTKGFLATGYYGMTSGVGQAVTALRGTAQNSGKPRNLRMGVIGLGVGTLAAYGRPGDYIRFYEINPDVIRIASNPEYFRYLRNCPARFNVVSGDARLSLERELGINGSQHFDLLVVDGFSGDAVPVHLLTRQAFQIYLNHMQDNGIIAVNITNTYIDLNPVIVAVASDMKMKSLLVHSDGDGRVTVYSDWALITRGPELDRLRLPKIESEPRRRTRLWTDDYTNLFAVLR